MAIDEIRVYGGSSIGLFNVSWPLAVFTYRDDKLRIEFRWGFVKKVAGNLAKSVGSSAVENESPLDWWACAPNELASATFGRRSVVFNGPRGGARFATSHNSVTLIVDLLTQLNVKTTEVLSTVPWYIGGQREKY
jgi:hypothetical protein